MKEPKTLTFVREKTTPNTVRFKEEPPPGQPPVVGSLYVQQWAAGDVQRLKVTIEAQ